GFHSCPVSSVRNVSGFAHAQASAPLAFRGGSRTDAQRSCRPPLRCATPNHHRTCRLRPYSLDQLPARRLAQAKGNNCNYTAVTLPKSLTYLAKSKADMAEVCC